jgi:hypothetical protein
MLSGYPCRNQLSLGMREDVHGPRGKAEGQCQSMSEKRGGKISSGETSEYAGHHHQPMKTCAIFFQGFLVLASRVNILKGLSRHDLPGSISKVLSTDTKLELVLVHGCSIKCKL